MDGKYGKLNRSRWRSAVNPDRVLSMVKYILIALVSLLLLEQGAYFFQTRSREGRQQAVVDTLVIYVYSGSDPEYHRNLEFFVNHAVEVRHSCMHRWRTLPPLGNQFAYIYILVFTAFVSLHSFCTVRCSDENNMPLDIAILVVKCPVA